MTKAILGASAAWRIGCEDKRLDCEDITPLNLSLELEKIGLSDIEDKRRLYFRCPKMGSSWAWYPILQKEFVEPTTEVSEFLIESLGVETAREVLEQKKVLAEKMPSLQDGKGKIVVVCGGEIFLGETFNEAWGKAREKYGYKPFYSGKIRGIPEFPSIYSRR